MDFDRDWHTFSLDAEVDAYGTSRIAGAHNRLREENARLKVAVEEIRREESYWRHTVVAKKLCPVHDNPHISHDCVEEILNWRSILTRERDEARAEWAALREHSRSEAESLRRERDEARAEVKKLQDSMVRHFQEEHLAGDGPEIDRWKQKAARLEGLILKVWEQSESDDDALRQLGPEACRIRGAGQSDQERIDAKRAEIKARRIREEAKP